MVNDDIFAGLGTGGPQGIMNSGALVSVIRQDLCSVAHADIITMWQHLLPRSRANSEWFINSEVQPCLDQLYFAGTTSVLSPYVGYRPDGVMTLYGRPVNMTEFSKGLGVKGDLLLADMSEFLFWEKGDVQAATSIHIAFLTDEQAFRFIYRCDGKTTYSSAITPYQTSQSLTQSSFVTLAAATS
jgi:HK97 family phage major capsid protein